MIRTILVSLVSMVMVTLVCHTFGQGAADIPVQTSYKAYRLLTVPTSTDVTTVPATTAVPEPSSWIFLAVGGAVIALAGVRRSVSGKRAVRN